MNGIDDNKMMMGAGAGHASLAGDSKRLLELLTEKGLGKALCDPARSAQFIHWAHQETGIPRILIRLIYHQLLVPIAKHGEHWLINKLSEQAENQWIKLLSKTGLMKRLANFNPSALKNITAPAQQDGDHAREHESLSDYLSGSGADILQDFKALKGLVSALVENGAMDEFLHMPAEESETLSADNTSLDELWFASGLIDFIKRAEYTDTLVKFADSDAPFAWDVVTGEAGSGKSRLVMEFMKHHLEGWKCGFLENNPQSLERWIPQAPTFIVIDNASFEAEMIRKVFERCNALLRKFPQCFKIRLLLVDRYFPDANENNVTNSVWSALLKLQLLQRFIQTHRASEKPIKLEPFTPASSKQLIQSISGRCASDIPQALIDALEDDAQIEIRHPLYLILAAQALRQDDQANINWNIIGLIEYALADSRRCPFLEAGDDNFYGSAWMAWDTMTGGDGDTPAPLGHLRDIGKPRTVAIHCLGRSARPYIIRPDILGEFFCLRFLYYAFENCRQDFEKFIKAVFQHSPVDLENKIKIIEYFINYWRQLGRDVARNGPDDQWQCFVKISQAV
ncbi:MAG: hypothetical protein AB8B77_08615, partial [Alphaproteobacteria bacterium]